MSKKQFTLGAFEFTRKNYVHRGQRIEINVPVVETIEQQQGNLKYPHYCEQKFVRFISLYVNILQIMKPKISFLFCLSQKRVYKILQLLLTITIVIVVGTQPRQSSVDEGDEKTEMRRGRDHRKSISNKFKAREVEAWRKAK